LSEGISHLYARRAREVQASAIREICKLIAKPEVRSLAGGWPDPATFPVEEIRDISRQVLEENPDLALQYTTSEGLPELRSFLADWVKKTDGIDCTPDELFITHGSAQGMELAAKILIEPGDVALVGLPTYFGGSGACRTFGAELCGVALDSDGMIPEALAEEVGKIQAAGKRAKLVYVVPDFQNPSGATMPAGRREQLVKIAEEHDLVIVEDNPYRDLRYSGEPVPPVKAYDTEGRVIYLRSFSKIFCPGLRLAFCVAHADAIRRMVIARQFEDCCANAFGQYVLYEFCKRGLLDKQIEKNRDHYRKKRDILLRAIEKHFPKEVRWNRPDGGFFVFAHLSEGLDGEALLKEAVGRNVAFVAGAPFFADGGGKNTFRLSFAQSEPEVIEEAVEELGKLIKGRVG
jgi:2-aminoadipate transaminase